MMDGSMPNMEKTIRDYLLGRHQPEWLEEQGIDRLTLREFLDQPAIRAEPGLTKAILAPMIAAAHRDQPERDRIKAEQMARDKTTWANQYGADRPPEEHSFSEFKMDYKYPTLRAAWRATQQWAAGVGKPMLVLSALPGRGKSHLAQAAWHNLAEKGRHPIWAPEAQLVQDLHAAVGKGTVNTIMESLTGAPHLILDDLGVAAQGDWIKGLMDQVIDARWSNPGLRTLVSMNIGRDDLPPRIASRLLDVGRGAFILINAPDYRQRRQ